LEAYCRIESWVGIGDRSPAVGSDTLLGPHQGMGFEFKYFTKFEATLQDIETAIEYSSGDVL
jgi:hypothetical protein